MIFKKKKKKDNSHFYPCINSLSKIQNKICLRTSFVKMVFEERKMTIISLKKKNIFHFVLCKNTNIKISY